MAAKKKFLVGLIAFFLVAMGALELRSANSDIWSVQGLGSLWNKDVAHVDSSGNFRLYNGSAILGDIGTTPSTSTGGFYGVKVPFLNVSTNSTAAGLAIVSAAGTSTTGAGTFAAVSATTTVIGICDGIYATNTVGYMTVAGYAIATGTGTFHIGDLVTTSPFLPGWVQPSNTTASGTVIGKAASTSSTSGGSVLIIVSQQ